MRKYAIYIFALGVSACLVGAALMAFGEGLLGENHTGIATVIGIIGIGLIGMAGSTYAASSSVKKRKNHQLEVC